MPEEECEGFQGVEVEGVREGWMGGERLDGRVESGLPGCRADHIESFAYTGVGSLALLSRSRPYRHGCDSIAV